MIAHARDDAGSVVSAARALLQRGMAPIPVPYRRKWAVVEGWQKLRLAESELAEHFSQATNIGVLCGDELHAMTPWRRCSPCVRALWRALNTAREDQPGQEVMPQ